MPAPSRRRRQSQMGDVAGAPRPYIEVQTDHPALALCLPAGEQPCVPIRTTCVAHRPARRSTVICR
ncbi:hypothetical protein C8039_13160 [Halogeometricum sp. wsp3]|nr:hypothetical protein C8039_13160 [Halogeometricum sp. wsp3]